MLQPKPIKRVTLEMSLKPFKNTDTGYIKEVWRTAFRQWEKLIERAGDLTVLLWVAEGSEILSWNGGLDQPIEWARYIGYMNDKYNRPDRVNNPVCGRPYIENPATITYRTLKEIIHIMKQVAQSEFGHQVQAGATFDIGPEFARSDFKYKSHPEINRAILDGREISLTTGADCVCSWSRLNEDGNAYAAYPDGIPQDTPFGQFLGRQAKRFMDVLNYDYIWFSNGFGFSCLPWTYLGVNFDGTQFNLANPGEVKEKLFEFWSAFQKECPYPVEVRGTNFSTGIDLSSDLVPLRELYDVGFFRSPPPNSPWGALDNDFGLELIGYMSRIAELPGEDFPFRYYINDPWYWQNPWWDYYNREPFDIYCPMSVARVNNEGQMQNPSYLEFITIDTEKGQLDPNCPMEVAPHINKAIKDAPDSPGILTWLYPFDEYSALPKTGPERMGTPFFEDWFIRNAINMGLPLNTVCSTRTFRQLGDRCQETFSESILCTPASTVDDALCEQLIRHVSSGGKVLLYGPPTGKAVLELLNLSASSGLSGECTLEMDLPVDDSMQDSGQASILHDPVISGGPLEDIVDKDDPFTRIRATARQGEKKRVFALTRSLPGWNGGIIAWVRGSLPFETRSTGRSPVSLPMRQDARFADTSILLKYVLADFSYSFRQWKPFHESREAICFVSRNDNAFLFSGFKHDTTVNLEFGFPDGAPIMIGRETKVHGDRAYHTFDKSFHSECRVFVRQPTDSLISCREVAPRPTALQHPQRRIRITGLKQAEVTIYPPVDKLKANRVQVNNSLSLPGSMYNETDYLDLSGSIVGNRIKLKTIDGPVEISW